MRIYVLKSRHPDQYDDHDNIAIHGYTTDYSLAVEWSRKKEGNSLMGYTTFYFERVDPISTEDIHK